MRAVWFTGGLVVGLAAVGAVKLGLWLYGDPDAEFRW